MLATLSLRLLWAVLGLDALFLRGLLGLGVPERPAPHDAAPLPNVLVVMVDDLGVDLVRAYGEGHTPPCMPTLEEFARGGVLFRNAWSNPRCSPTRAQFLTGRHAFRTGVGAVIEFNESQASLPNEEVTIAELLPPEYATEAFGKWHLALPGPEALVHPNLSGFDHFAGLLYNVPQPPIGDGAAYCTFGNNDYWRWVKVTDGVESCETTYATTDTIDAAIDWMGSAPAPWFSYVAVQSIHLPFHDAPSELCGAEPCFCGSATPSPPLQAKAMAEALDTELARLLPHVPPATYVVFVADNGTSEFVAEGPAGGCFDPARSKGTVYQGGVRVPLIVAGPGVPRGVELDVLVSVTDLFATIAQLAGVPSAAEDSVSLVPYLRGATASVRATVYAETFDLNGDPSLADTHDQAVRNECWKLIRKRAGTVVTEELYEIVRDPCESFDLCDDGDCSGLAGHALEAYLDLVQALPWGSGGAIPREQVLPVARR